MNAITASVEERVRREVSRQVGYRLITWALAGLLATAIFIVFRLFRDFPPVVDNWVLWIVPLMILRGCAALILLRQLQHLYLRAIPWSTTHRMSLLFGVSDGLLLLTANLIFGGFYTPSSLLMVTVAALSLLSIIYIFTPAVVLTAAGVVTLPSLAVAVQSGLRIPVELALAGAAILGGTFFAMMKFRALLLRSLRQRFEVEQQVDEASESNFIFDQHWRKTTLAAIDWDSQFRVRSWNPAAERLFGFSAGQAIGQPPELIFGADQALAMRRLWQQMHQSDHSRFSRHEILSADGRILLTEWHDTPLTFEGELIGIASFVHPVRNSRAAGAEAEEAGADDFASVSAASR